MGSDNGKLSTEQQDEKISATEMFEDVAEKRDKQGKVIKVLATQKDSPMAEALLIERPKFVSPSIFRLFGCLFVAYLCSAQNGFDANTFGGVSDMPNFKAQFGTNIASTTGFLAAIYVIGKFNYLLEICAF